jgi:acetyl-CoA/propionyl-CoA carboxylase biotin carboxyl carrier protein
VEDELDLAALLPTDAEAAAAPAGTEPDAPPLVERTVPVEVNGKRFSVRMWLPDAPMASSSSGPARARPRPAQSAGGAGGAGNGTITAPMQGTIVKVLVAEGDEVEIGQAILVLEAMKMENHINAETSGTVKEIRVASGDTVGTGDVLVVIE